jgi:hypothetical protein
MTTRELIGESGAAAWKATAGAGAAAWTAADGQVALSIVVAALTAVFMVVQTAYLIWKWRRNSRTPGVLP